MGHPMVRLAEKIDWAFLDGRFGSVCQPELHLVEGGGHMIHHTAPDRIVEAVDAVAARPAEKVTLNAAAE
jgi:pimeloyl-ACP methyl ester carboxylesterase